MIASVVIPTCERNDDLALCLGRLDPVAQSLTAGMFEVIVTDDDRRSTARNMIEKEFPWVRWVQGTCCGPAANRNNGVAFAQGEWIIFIDDDCLPEPGFLRAFFDAMNRHEGRVLEGRTSSTGLRTRLDMDCPANETGGCLWSCNMAIRRDLFLEIGGFDPHFPAPAMEDVDLRTRLLKAGEVIQFVSEARVLHPWRRRKGLAFVPVVAESIAYYVTKHPEHRQLSSWSFLCIDMARKLLSHIPRAAWHCGVQGLGNVLAETWYTPFAIRRALRRSRKRPSS